MIKNKKAMSLAVVFLVLATLVLTVFSLFVFNMRADNLSKPIELAILEGVYAKEDSVNFYINEIIEKSVESGISQDSFIINFLAELNKHKINGEYVVPELSQIEEQADKNHLKVENGKATAEFKINLEEKVITNKKELFSAIHTYNKKFEKTL